MNGRSQSLSSEKGSILIVALLLCAIIGISLASYIKLGKSVLDEANRSLYANASMNLAEEGLEEALYSLNQQVQNSSYSWTGAGWTISGSDVLRAFTGFTFDQKTTGEVRVRIYNYSSTNPRVVARSTVTLGGTTSPVIEKWVMIQLSKASKFDNGLVAKNSITFSGNNASVDSWNSDPDNNPATPAIPYSSSVAHDAGGIGSISVSVSAVLVNNANIWGYVATGGAAPSVGSNGLIGPFGTPSGTVVASRVSTDFTANFDAVSVPTQTPISIPAITSTTSLPRAGDSPASDGKYYYTAPQIDFNNQTLSIAKRTGDTVSPNVVLILTDTSDSIDIGGGSGEIAIQTGATFSVYAPGDISIAGNGILNGGTTSATANQPIAMQIWGTAPTGSSQNIQIAGNGVLSAVLYAPQGNLKINGNGDVLGSMVANNVSVTGNAAFHYDESLANFGGGNPFRVSLWNELTSATDRAAYASDLSF
ncbi:hypothetical protein GALL_230240 [mine drainage metagenome]|uniref:DUF7305 domain-containing protein n=1 Tax=mine drainage metagenome TaxID=410659 RepID=A0A1J5RHV3_9ZZZZ